MILPITSVPSFSFFLLKYIIDEAAYLSPEPHRGKSNEPGRTRFVAEKLAGIFDLSFESMAKKTNNNSSEIFQLP